MKRHELWRLEYRNNRYMRDLPVADVLARAGHIIGNMSIHDKDGRLSLKPVELEQDSSGVQRFTHVLEELKIRGFDYRDRRVFEAMNPPRPKSPRVMRALATLGRRAFSPPFLVKFGQRQHMADLLLKGRGRISLATSYKDGSLGYARADDESLRTAFIDPSDAHYFEKFGINVPYLGSVPIDVEATTDFYVYCLAEATDPRLFDDFDADACVVITRPDAFKERIQKAIFDQLPGWKYLAAPAIYFDPFFAQVHLMVPHFWKHFRFGYQKEYRLVWLPPAPDWRGRRPPIEHIWFEIGPLTDCAKLVWL